MHHTLDVWEGTFARKATDMTLLDRHFRETIDKTTLADLHAQPSLENTYFPNYSDQLSPKPNQEHDLMIWFPNQFHPDLAACLVWNTISCDRAND
jgi:hypothetical protein